MRGFTFEVCSQIQICPVCLQHGLCCALLALQVGVNLAAFIENLHDLGIRTMGMLDKRGNHKMVESFFRSRSQRREWYVDITNSSVSECMCTPTSVT